MTSAPDFSVVIVNWNAGPRLVRAVDSIVSAPPRGTWEIVVVDNASTDGSLDAVQDEPRFADVLQRGSLRLIRSDRNRGFAAANNDAFRATTGRLVLLLNPDAEAEPGAVDTLRHALEADERIGAVGPQLVGLDGEVQVSVWKNPPAPTDILVSHLGLYRFLPPSFRARWLLGPHWRHDERRVVPMVMGAAMLVRRQVIDEVGGFDERFHVYCEDNEWCLRIVRAGWLILFEPAARVIHEGGASSTQRWRRLEAIEQHVNADYLLHQISLSPWRAVVNQLAYCIGAAGQMTSRAIRGLDRSPVLTAFRRHRVHLRHATGRALGRKSAGPR